MVLTIDTTQEVEEVYNVLDIVFPLHCNYNICVYFLFFLRSYKKYFMNYILFFFKDNFSVFTFKK